jgi:hypothetical protein
VRIEFICTSFTQFILVIFRVAYPFHVPDTNPLIKSLNWNEIVNPTSALIGIFRNASSTNDHSINFIHVSYAYNMNRYIIW